MKYFAAAALLPDGWARNVTIDVDADGMIEHVASGGSSEGRHAVAGPLVPAMPNLHSHAFQRALAGRTGRKSPAASDDSFWTWRAGDVRVPRSRRCRSVRGDRRTGVRRDGRRRATRRWASFTTFITTPQASRMRIRRNSRGASSRPRTPRVISLTLLPVFYAQAGFGGTAATAGAAPLRARTVDVHAPRSSDCASAAGRRSLRARRRAAQPARGDARGARSRRATREHQARRSTSTPPSRHARWRNASRGSGLRPVEWLLDARQRGRALVPRACDAHDRARDHRAGGQRRGDRARSDDRSGPGRRHVPRAGLSALRAGASVSAATRTRSSRPLRNCASSSGRSACRARRRNVLAGDRRVGGRQHAVVARGARRRAGRRAAAGRDRGGPAGRPRRARHQ